MKKNAFEIQRWPLSRMESWALNPRRADYRGMEELKASLTADGQEEAIHIWETTEADLVLRGNRRLRAMTELGWTECDAVVHHFESEEEAYCFCLRPHGLTDPLDAEEKITAVENGVKLGLTAAELAPVLGLKEERVQLYFDLGQLLPLAAREALMLAENGLSLHVAELLIGIKNPMHRREAAMAVLSSPDTGEPMAYGQAKAFVQSRYVLPAKWRDEWEIKSAALKRRGKRVVDGYQHVEWEQRLEFVQGESGQPLPEFELGESLYPRDAEGRTWEQVAVEMQVPVYVVAAPRHADGFVTVVNAAMMRDAKSLPRCARNDETGAVLRGETAKDERTKDEGRMTNEEGAGSAGPVPDAKAEALKRWLRVWLGAIYEHLIERPTDVMCKGPWLPLQDYLAHVTTDVDAGALEAWRGITMREEALAFIESDKVNRAPLRMALMMLLCAESDASDQPQRKIREVAASLGLDAGKLEEMAAR